MTPNWRFVHPPELTGRLFSSCRLAVSDCAPQTSRVSSNLHSSSSMAVSRVPSPPPPEVNTPVAENWCYTQVRFVVGGSLSSAGAPPRFSTIDSPAPKFTQSRWKLLETRRNRLYISLYLYIITYIIIFILLLILCHSVHDSIILFNSRCLFEIKSPNHL